MAHAKQRSGPVAGIGGTFAISDGHRNIPGTCVTAVAAGDGKALHDHGPYVEA